MEIIRATPHSQIYKDRSKCNIYSFSSHATRNKKETNDILYLYGIWVQLFLFITAHGIKAFRIVLHKFFKAILIPIRSLRVKKLLTAAWTSASCVKRCPPRWHFRAGERWKSLGTKSREYRGCGKTCHPFFRNRAAVTWAAWGHSLLCRKINITESASNSGRFQQIGCFKYRNMFMQEFALHETYHTRRILWQSQRMIALHFPIKNISFAFFGAGSPEAHHYLLRCFDSGMQYCTQVSSLVMINLISFEPMSYSCRKCRAVRTFFCYSVRSHRSQQLASFQCFRILWTVVCMVLLLRSTSGIHDADALNVYRLPSYKSALTHLMFSSVERSLCYPLHISSLSRKNLLCVKLFVLHFIAWMGR